MASSSSPNPPAIRGFQLDASAIGNAQKSVNLFRGDVNFPLKLVSLTGPNGLDLNLSAFYSGSIAQQVDTWNLDAPTGVLGLGWSLPFDFIEFQHTGTASYLDGQFLAHIDGRLSELVLIIWINRGKESEQIEFADPAHPLWQIIYQTLDELWTIKRDDGMTMSFGGSTSHPDAVQWGVRWDNWVGSSTFSSGEPKQFGMRWNLAETSNQWGNTLTYWYQSDKRTVAGSAQYTRASYLSRVQDAYGRTVEFVYKDKDPHEYQPPQTVDGKAPDAAYQDRFETQYLAGLDVKALSGDLYYSIDFDSQPLSLDKTADANSALTTTCKRYLLQVRQHRNGRDMLPPLKFDYDFNQDSISRGKVMQVTYPAGGTVSWSYQEQSVGNSEIFNLDYTAHRPSDPAYRAAMPRLWFGPDYVVIAWYSDANSRIMLQVFEYGGRWATTPHEEELDGAPASIDDVHLAFGSDFFTIYFHNQGRLFVYQKTPYQFGHWTRYLYQDIQSGDSNANETALVTGSDFIALHAGGSHALYRFAFDRRTKEWSPKPGDDLAPTSGPQSETRMALAGQGDMLAVGFFGENGQITDQFYWLDSGSESEPQWRAGIDNPSSHGSATWNPNYVSTYMRMGAGFAVGTYLEGGQSKLHVTTWKRNFSPDHNAFSDAILDGDSSQGIMPPPTSLSGSTIVNQGRLYRYNGSTWIDVQVAWGGKAVALAGDTVLAATLDGSGFDTQIAQYDPLQNADDAWAITTLETPNASPTTPAPPQFGGRYLTIGANLFFVGTDGKLTNVEDAFDDSSGTTVACLGPHYIAYETDGQADQRSTKIALLLNGKVDGEPISLAGQRIGVPSATGTVLTGTTAFATYDSQYDDFRDVPQFTLHRILNRHIGGYSKGCVVSKLEISTGTQVLRTVYTYDPTSALFDPSGEVAQYPLVTAERLDTSLDTLGNSLGKTVFEYLNGLEPDDQDDPLAGCYSLANGYLKSTTQYSPDGKVSSTQNSWQGLQLSMLHDGGFAMLANSIVLVQTKTDHILHNLPVIALGSAEDSDTLHDLTSAKEMAYDSATAYLLRQSQTQYNSQGQQALHQTEYRYAWTLEQYAAMRDARLLQPIAQTTLIVDGATVQSNASTYQSNWGNVDGWGPNATFAWLGTGETDFDFDLQAAPQGWQQQSQILSRNSSGIITERSDSTGVVTSVLLDTTGARLICQFTNASVQNAEAIYSGFEPYEADLGWTTADGGTIDALLTKSNCHTGSQCIHLPASASPGLQNSRLKTSTGSSHLLFGCWVKTPAQKQNEVNACWTITVGTSPTQTLPIPATQGRWVYICVHVPFAGAGESATCQLENESELWVDNILLMPLLASFAGTVYDSATLLPIARLGPNGETTRAFYDEKLYRIATSSADENVESTTTTFLSREGNDADTYDHNQPNAQLSIQARGGGLWDDFKEIDYTDRWLPSGNPAAWQTTDGALVHVGTGEDSVSLAESDGYAEYAVRVQVCATKSPQKPVSIQVGDQLVVRWKPQEIQWEMLVNGASVASFDGLLGCDWLLIARQRSATFFLNGRQILQYVGSPNKPITGALSLTTADQAVSFAQVLIFRQPLVKLTYTDGTNRTIQHHALDDGGIVVREIMYDELGRAAIWTKPARLDEVTPGFQPSFSAPPNPTTGVMGGYVGEYYNGKDGRSDDAGYPYTRKRFEMSGLNRLLEVGQPGKQLAIRPGNLHTQKHRVGINGQAAFLTPTTNRYSLPEQKYLVKLVIEPNGKHSAKVHDATGRSIAQLEGPADFPMKQTLATAVVLDPLGNVLVSMPPNSFNPPPGSETKAWWTTARYDALGRITGRGDPDMGEIDAATGKKIPGSGVTRYIYDLAGRVRFMIEPVGAEQNPNLVLYWKYDLLGRIVEKGTCQFTWGDGASLQIKANSAPEWPSTQDGVSSIWKKRYFYDGDSADEDGKAILYAVGQLTQVIVNNGDGQQADVLEEFAYDIHGNVISKALQVTDYDGNSHNVAYEYDLLGNVTRVTYGASEAPSEDDQLHQVVYSYDSLGQMVGIGPSPEAQDAFAAFRYYADGKLAEETLNHGAISIPYAYESAGWPAQIGDSKTPFSELFEYGADEREGISEDPSSIRFEYQTNGNDNQPSPDSYGYAYQYDIHARLRQATSPEHPDWHVGTQAHPIMYDGNDNIIALSREGEVESDSYYPGTNQLKSSNNTGYSLSYDPNGNVIEAPSRGLTFTIDPFTQMTTSIDVAGNTPRNLSFSYGNSNQRVLKTVSESEVTSSQLYVRGISAYPQTVRTKTSSGDERVVHYIYGPTGLVAMFASEQWYFILRDHERSTRFVLTDSGQLAAGYDYLPFGKEVRRFGPEPEIIAYRYTGQEYDQESGLYNYRARMYDADLGRFLSPDPKRQYPSPYVYVGDDPIRLTDPTGESFWSVFDDVVSFVVDAAEVVGAIALEGATFGGATAAAGALMGAGVEGFAYTATHLNEDDPGKFWGGYGISQATGALSGALTGGVGGLEVSAGKQIALGVVAGAAAAEIEHVGNNLTAMATGEAADWGATGFGIEAGVGALGGGLGSAAGIGIEKGLSKVASKGLKMGLSFVAGAAIEGGLDIATYGIKGEKVNWLKFSLKAAAGGISGAAGAHSEARRQSQSEAQSRLPGGRLEPGVEMYSRSLR